jgi:alcohol dehydrogenase, propanol-preferring
VRLRPDSVAGRSGHPAVTPRPGRPPAKWNGTRHEGADVATGLAVDDRSFATAYAGLRRGGRLVLVALPASGTLPLPVFDTVLNGTSVIGSIVGTRADLIQVFGLHAAGRTRVSYETRPLAEVNAAIDDVLHGKAKARIVLEP